MPNSVEAVAQSPRPKTGLGVIFLTVFVDLIGFSLIFPLFPSMLEHYLALEADTGGALSSLVVWLDGLSGAESGAARAWTTVLFGGLLGSLYSALQFVCAPLWGQLSDRIGRRRVLLWTTAGIALSYVAWFFAASFWVLVLSRTVGGIMAGNISVASAAIADVTRPEERAKGMGALGAAFGLGFLLGPVLGGVLSLVDLTSLPLPGVNPYSGAALGAFVLAVINMAWVRRRFAETLPEERRGKGQGRPLNPITLVTPTAFPAVNRTNAVYFVYILAFTGMEFTLTFLARDRFDYTPLKNGLLFVYVGFLVAAVQGGVVRRLAPRLGERKLAQVGLWMIVPGLLVTGTATYEPVLYAGLGVLSVGSALATPTLTALVSLYAPDDRQGELLGIFRSLGSLGRALGPLLACVLYWKLGPAAPYVAAAAILLVPAGVSLTLPKASRGNDAS